jgi:hypothetical protein
MKWWVSVVSSFIVMGAYSKELQAVGSDGMTFKAHVCFPSYKAEPLFVGVAENIVIPNDSNHTETTTNSSLKKRDCALQGNFIVQRERYPFSFWEVNNRVVPVALMSKQEVIARRRKWQLNFTSECCMFDVSGRGLTYIPRFYGDRNGFAQIYLNVGVIKNWIDGKVGASLLFPDFPVVFDGGSGLPKRQEQHTQPANTNDQATDGSNKHTQGPKRHILLCLQVLVGVFLYFVGLNLIRYATSNEMLGWRRDGAALCYFIVGLLSFTFGVLLICAIPLFGILVK